jgi:lysozyme family protein
MAASTYDEALRRLLAHEGGYSNHPSDPGGPTNFGITLADYRRYIKPDATAADVRAMSVAEAKAIYRKRYWDAQRCDELPAGVDYSIFDYGVNSGIGRSGKVLRRVVGLRDNTSAVTDEVLAAVAKRDAKALVIAINDERLRFLEGLRTWPVFGAGWGRRVADVKAISVQLAESSTIQRAPVPEPTPTEVAPGKGIVPVPNIATHAVTKGVPAGGVAGALACWDWVAAHPFEAGALAIVGAGAIGGAAYALNRWHRARQEAPTPGLVPVSI